MRARRQHGRGKRGHGALWSIIYIDLMTQIMAFFVIVWTIEHGTKATATVNLATGFGMGDQTVRMVDLPGDVLFASGKTDLAADGKDVIGKLFGDAASGVLNFDRGGMAQRKLVIHGHTDDVGIKDENFQLGYQRAWSVYQEIRRHSKELPDHVILCTHANNTPTSVLPAPADPKLTEEEKAVIAAARAKNRRITIEDLVVAAPVARSDAPQGGAAPAPPAAPGSGAPPPPTGSSGSQGAANRPAPVPHASTGGALPRAPVVTPVIRGGA
jgi:flagellar motor protein MotB